MEYYFKQKPKYSKSEDYIYYKLTDKGEIISISTNKNTISKPKTVSMEIGFEIVEKEEFDKIYNKIISQF